MIPEAAEPTDRFCLLSVLSEGRLICRSRAGFFLPIRIMPIGCRSGGWTWAKPLVAAKGQEKGKVVFEGYFDLLTKPAMCLIEKGLVGGPGEDRTPDPMVANHVLSQLSYRPFRVTLLY